MNKTTIVGLVLGLALGVGGGYWLGTRSEHSTAVPPTPSAQGDRKVLYWYDPMYPQHRFEKPGKSPFMEMQLVPKHADETSEKGTVGISPQVTQNLGIRTAEARAGSLAPTLTAVGNVEYNERTMVVVQPRVNGFIEKLHVRAPLDAVRAGAPLAEVLLPEWAGAQEEYLLLRRRTEPGMRELAAAARQRLVLTGMSEEQIAAVEREGKVQARITLRAPISGVIAELGAREGMTVTAGATLFRIAGLGTVWVVAQVPEAQAGMLVPEAKAEVRVPAYPDETFAGRVSAILPEVSAATRTVRARLEVQNAAGKLKPGMYANLTFVAAGKEALIVPSDAVIRTGGRSVVILAESEGKFRVVDVESGMESAGNVEIRKGLRAGDKVVVSGQFLIDSEASLRSALGRLSAQEPQPDPASSKPQALHRGSGTVMGVDAATGRVELEHGPIPSMKWPSMKMGFAVMNKDQLTGVKIGDKVEFALRSKPDSSGAYVIEKIAPTAKQAKP